MGRRWNLDPKPVTGVSEYSAFLNNPLWYSDPLGDTIRNADVARAIGKEKVGQDLAGSSMKAGDYTLVPIQKSLEDKTIIGYNAFRNQRQEYQLDPSDIEAFKSNSAAYAKAADAFYSAGTPDYDYLRYYQGIFDGDLKMMWQGLKGMWTSAAKDPAFVASLALSFGHSGLSMMRAKGAPKPSPKFKAPTNSPQNPILNVPNGYTVRIMKPTQQYPNGYWVLEKPMPQGGYQKVNPSTMKPGAQHETHVPLPEGYWK